MNPDSDDQSVDSQNSKVTRWIKKRKALSNSQPLFDATPPKTNTQFTIEDLREKNKRILKSLHLDKDCSKENSVDVWLFTISLLLYSLGLPDKIEIAKDLTSRLLAKTQNHFMPLPGDFSETKMIMNPLTESYFDDIEHELKSLRQCRIVYEPTEIMIFANEDRFYIFNKIIDVRKSCACEKVVRMLEVMRSKLQSNDIELSKLKSQVDYCFEMKDLKDLLVPMVETQTIRPCSSSLPVGKPSIAEVNRLLKQKYPDKTPHTSQEKEWGKSTMIYDIIGCYCHIHKRLHAGNHQYVSWNVSYRNIRYKCHHKEEGQTSTPFVNLTR